MLFLLMGCLASGKCHTIAGRQFCALQRARAFHVRNQGFSKDPWEVFDLNQIDDIIDKRIDQLTVHFTRQGLAGDEARQAALDQVAKEFGLP